MAAVRLRWCERCGKMNPGHRYAIPMHKGVWALVCNECRAEIYRRFKARPRDEWRPSDLYPALYERTQAR